MSYKVRLTLLITLIVAIFGLRPQSTKLSSEELLNLVNQDRATQGLRPLKHNPTLSLAALAKASDMVERNYFSHVSPDGVKPWHWFKTLGYNYVYAGENLAIGFNDPSELEESWMSSPKHRANILSPLYSEIGLAIVEKNDKTLIVQFFGTKDSKISLTEAYLIK